MVQRDQKRPERGPVAQKAAGMTALRVTWAHARRQTGTVKALRVLRTANQHAGFDCPGCAWPDPAHRSDFEFCENGAKAILDEATKRRADEDFFSRHGLADLSGRSERWLNAQGRLVVPLTRGPDDSHFRPLSYEQAYELIAEEMSRLDHPDQAVFYTSGRASNEAAYLYQLMVRAFGTNNLPDCSNLCHESSGVALKETLGIGKGTVRLRDFQETDLVFVIGQNPGTNHPRMLSALRDAKLRGARVVSVNPLIEAGLVSFAHPQKARDMLFGGVPIADDFVRVMINGDQAFFRGLNKALLESKDRAESIDEEFIVQFTDGFSAFEEEVRGTDWERISTLSGVERAEIERIAGLVRASRSTICCWAMGLTQHQNSVVTIQEVVNFLLLRGNVGKPGAGACPVRGHSNVQGDRSVGIATQIPEVVQQNMERRYGFSVPTTQGLDTVATLGALKAGKVRAFFSLGGNFLSAGPDTEFAARALARCDLSVQIATKLNRTHLVAGKRAVILPCLGRTETVQTEAGPQFVTVENSMGVVHASSGTLPPAHPLLRSEPRIVCDLAQKLLPKPALPWALWSTNHDSIREEIATVVPGFSDYNQRVRAEGGFELENGPRERRFTTQSGRALFVAAPLSRIEAREGEMVLMTVRSHDQFNTTVYSNEDRYRGVRGNRRVLLCHPKDLAARGLQSGDPVTISSHFEGQTREVTDFFVLAYDIPEGAAAAYFPEANPLIFVESQAARSNTPTSKSVRIKLRPRSLASQAT